jgi:hypothetical protein
MILRWCLALILLEAGFEMWESALMTARSLVYSSRVSSSDGRGDM